MVECFSLVQVDKILKYVIFISTHKRLLRHSIPTAFMSQISSNRNQYDDFHKEERENRAEKGRGGGEGQKKIEWEEKYKFHE